MAGFLIMNITQEDYDKAIRGKAIDELKNEICMHFADWKCSEDDKWIKDIIESASESVEEIAEQMKAGTEMKEFIEKLIEKLEKLNAGGIKMIEDGKYELIRKKEAIQIVNELAEEYKGGWIPCSDKLPSEDKQYEVTVDKRRYGKPTIRERCI